MFFLGLKLTGGTGSKLQGLFVLEIVPESPASQEGSLQPHDQIISICGFWTEDMSLDDAVSVCEAVSQNVHIRAIRYVGHMLLFEFFALCSFFPLHFSTHFSSLKEDESKRFYT